MLEVITLAQLFDKSLEVIGLVKQGKKERNDKIDQALFALYTALNETTAYLDDLKSGKRRNRRREHKLAYLWHDASVPVRYIDRDLARRCFLKGSLWLKPEVWSRDRVKQSKITINNILNAVRELLMR